MMGRSIEESFWESHFLSSKCQIRVKYIINFIWELNSSDRAYTIRGNFIGSISEFRPYFWRGTFMWIIISTTFFGITNHTQIEYTKWCFYRVTSVLRMLNSLQFKIIWVFNMVPNYQVKYEFSWLVNLIQCYKMRIAKDIQTVWLIQLKNLRNYKICLRLVSHSAFGFTPNNSLSDKSFGTNLSYFVCFSSFPQLNVKLKFMKKKIVRFWRELKSE